MAGYSSYWQWANHLEGTGEQYLFASDIDDGGTIEGETVTVRVDIDSLLLEQLRSRWGNSLTDQTICRHAIATLIGYPSYASCKRQEHYVPEEEQG